MGELYFYIIISLLASFSK